MSTAPGAAPHPILACATRIRGELAGVADAQPLYMAVEDKAAALVELARVEAQVAELKLRVLAAADDVAAASGARDAAAWLAHHTQADPKAIRADLELATALDRRYPKVAAGMATGTVSMTHARVIVRSLEDLAGLDDTVIDEATRDKAQQQLVDWAGQFRPNEVRRLGRRVLEVVAPDVADAAEARRLAAEEEHAAKKASLRLQALGDGTTRITGRLPDPVAVRLRTFLDAITSPRRHSRSPRPAGPDPVGLCRMGGGYRHIVGMPRRWRPCSNTSTPTRCPTTAGTPPR